MVSVLELLDMLAPGPLDDWSSEQATDSLGRLSRQNDRLRANALTYRHESCIIKQRQES